MFIAVRPVFQKTVAIADKVLIFDTEDMSLEYVSLEDLKSLITYDGNIPCIGKEKIYGALLDTKEYKYTVDALFVVLPKKGIETTDDSGIVTKYSGKIYYSDNSVWNFDEYFFYHDEVIVYDDKAINYNIVVNGRVVYSGSYLDSYNIHYVFRFMDYLVIRFTYLLDTPYFTIVLDKKSKIVSIYSSEEFIYGDKSLYTRIETTAQY